MKKIFFGLMLGALALIDAVMCIKAPSIINALVLVYCVGILLFLLLKKHSNIKLKALFPYISFIIIGHIIGALSAINHFHLLLSKKILNTMLSGLGPLAFISFTLIMEYISTNTIKWTQTKKIVGFIGLLLTILICSNTSLELSIYSFGLLITFISFFKALALPEFKKTKLYPITKYVMGLDVPLSVISFIFMALYDKIPLNTYIKYNMHVVLNGVRSVIFLTFITGIILIILKEKNTVHENN